jgi:hypothetical protein
MPKGGPSWLQQLWCICLRLSAWSWDLLAAPCQSLRQRHPAFVLFASMDSATNLSQPAHSITCLRNSGGSWAGLQMFSLLPAGTPGGHCVPLFLTNLPLSLFHSPHLSYSGSDPMSNCNYLLIPSYAYISSLLSWGLVFALYVFFFLYSVNKSIKISDLVVRDSQQNILNWMYRARRFQDLWTQPASSFHFWQLL